MCPDSSLPEHAALEKPSPARIYDYFLGGHHNFAIDRQTAERVIAIYPDAPLAAQANRAFLRRAVTFLIAQGIDQFLDIGSGIPTVGSVHEVAQGMNPEARVVYVDIDPIVVNHSQAIVQGNMHTIALQADVRQPARMLAHRDVQRLLDIQRPIGVLLLLVMHFIADDDEAYRIVAFLRDAVAPGSYLALSHTTHDNIPSDVSEQIMRLYAGSTNPGHVRSRAQIERFFDGLAVVEPGVAFIPLWRPENVDDIFLDQPERSVTIGGVGLKV
jgi:S-adenosyl methyltransferase